MRDLLSRLEGIEFILLAPNSRPVGSQFGGTLVDPARYRRFLAAVSRLRSTEVAVAENKINPNITEAPADSRDWESWHLVVRVPARAEIVGAIRMRVYDLNATTPDPANLF